tara:strand:+ start:28 stop:348 length:321 start_codon:yes stop_codon:yes gene_type:complete
MKIFKKFILINLLILFTSCGILKDGFINQKKNNNDEFLVEKKSPLVMPPDYSELPLPNKENNQTQTMENSIKNLVTNEQKITNSSNMESSESRDIEESLLDKIKNN